MELHDEKGTVKDLVLYRLETAKVSLNSAKILHSSEDYKGANNRAYYSIFHSITAVHAIKGKAYKRHKDAIANFNREYVKTEIFPRSLGRRIGEAEVIRNASDYDDFYIAKKSDVDELISTAEELFDLVEKYCKEQLKINDGL